MIVRMWEVRAYPKTFDGLLCWVCDEGVPVVEGHPLHVSSEVFSSADHRIVVISRWRRDPVDLPAPPEALVLRQPHAWEFTPVDR